MKKPIGFFSNSFGFPSSRILPSPITRTLCGNKNEDFFSLFSPSPVILHDVGQPVSHGDNGGQVKQLQQQPLYPGLLAALQATGRLVQNQDSENMIMINC